MARQFILEEAVESGQQVREECEVGGDGELEGDLHLDTSGSDEQVQTTSRRKYADKRYFKRCPVPGCASEKAFKKVTQHIQYAHPHISSEERKQLMKNVRRLPKAEISRVRPHLPRGQCTIERFITQPPPVDPSPPEPSMPSLPPERLGKKGSTRGFPKFSLDSKEVMGFRQFLVSVDGTLKLPHIAKAIATDVSKFLRFCHPEASSPDWSMVYQRQRILDYLDHLKVVGGCSQDGQLSWLDSISHALRYAQNRLLADADPGHNTCQRIERDLKAWKASLRKQKAVHVEERRQEFLETPSSLQEVTDFTECPGLWREYQSVVEAIKNGEEVAPRDLNLCTVAVAALFLYSSWQRAGAVENCTVREYGAKSTVRNLDGSNSVVINVKQHKTRHKGPAGLVLDERHLEKLLSYVDIVRPVIDPQQASPYLFVRYGPKKLKQISNRVKAVGRRFDVEAPTATRVRKIGSTAAALQCGTSKEAKMISKHMSHTDAVHEKYYEMLGSSSHTASAFQVMERLRKGEEKPKSTLRKRFTAEDEEAVKEYFAPAILAGNTPSLEECSEFLRGRELDRSKKQIQDKVKNLIKHTKLLGEGAGSLKKTNIGQSEKPHQAH